jgi:hypothetical protein
MAGEDRHRGQGGRLLPPSQVSRPPGGADTHRSARRWSSSPTGLEAGPQLSLLHPLTKPYQHVPEVRLLRQSDRSVWDLASPRCPVEPPRPGPGRRPDGPRPGSSGRPAESNSTATATERAAPAAPHANGSPPRWSSAEPPVGLPHGHRRPLRRFLPHAVEHGVDRRNRQVRPAPSRSRYRGGSAGRRPGTDRGGSAGRRRDVGSHTDRSDCRSSLT